MFVLLFTPPALIVWICRPIKATSSWRRSCCLPSRKLKASVKSDACARHRLHDTLPWRHTSAFTIISRAAAAAATLKPGMSDKQCFVERKSASISRFLIYAALLSDHWPDIGSLYAHCDPLPNNDSRSSLVMHMQQTLMFIFFLCDLKCEFAWCVSEWVSSVACACEEEFVQATLSLLFYCQCTIAPESFF